MELYFEETTCQGPNEREGRCGTTNHNVTAGERGLQFTVNTTVCVGIVEVTGQFSLSGCYREERKVRINNWL